MKRFLSILLLTLFAFTLSAQTKSTKKFEEEEKEPPITRWNYGLNLGVYFANKYPAGFYNGSPGNENTVMYVLNNYYWYQAIKQSLGVSQSDTILVLGYPTDMHYNVVMTGGLFLRYNFNKNYGFCIDVNYTKLTATDAVVLGVPPNILTDTTKFIQPIQGVEQRVHFDILLQRNFWLKSKMYILTQGGLNLNYTKVLKNIMNVAPTDYNLVNIYGNNTYVPGAYVQETQVLQGGVGYGFALGAGLGIPLVNQFGVEIGGNLNYNNVQLTGYTDFKPSYGIYARFLFGNIVPKQEEE